MRGDGRNIGIVRLKHRTTRTITPAHGRGSSSFRLSSRRDDVERRARVPCRPSLCGRPTRQAVPRAHRPVGGESASGRRASRTRPPRRRAEHSYDFARNSNMLIISTASNDAAANGSVEASDCTRGASSPGAWCSISDDRSVTTSEPTCRARSCAPAPAPSELEPCAVDRHLSSFERIEHGVASSSTVVQPTPPPSSRAATRPALHRRWSRRHRPRRCAGERAHGVVGAGERFRINGRSVIVETLNISAVWPIRTRQGSPEPGSRGTTNAPGDPGSGNLSG